MWCTGEPGNHPLTRRYSAAPSPHSISAPEGDFFGAAVRYALLAEQGSPTAVLNLAWLMHRGLAYRGADRHRLALGLWERGAARGQTEGMLMAAHVLMDGERYRLEGGETARLGGGRERAAGMGPGWGSALVALQAVSAAGLAHHLPSSARYVAAHVAALCVSAPPPPHSAYPSPTPPIPLRLPPQAPT